MRLLATMVRTVRSADSRRWMATAAAARIHRSKEEWTIRADLRLPSSSMLKHADNEKLSVVGEDLAD